jgi:hypothetical protein
MKLRNNGRPAGLQARLACAGKMAAAGHATIARLALSIATDYSSAQVP